MEMTSTKKGAKRLCLEALGDGVQLLKVRVDMSHTRLSITESHHGKELAAQPHFAKRLSHRPPWLKSREHAIKFEEVFCTIKEDNAGVFMPSHCSLFAHSRNPMKPVASLCRSVFAPSISAVVRPIAALTLLALAVVGHATVLFEDYRGQHSVPATLTPPSWPSYANYPNGPGLGNLIVFSANASNAIDTGSATAVDWPVASYTLCNMADGTGPTQPSCVAGIQGRVAYARLLLPQVGQYTFAAAHDDQVDVDFSSQITTAYRSASYDIPVGNLADYTGGDNSFETLGNYATGTANACLLMRIYWNNQDGINLLRLQWTPPSSAAAIIPAANLLDPSVAQSTQGCADVSATADLSLVKVLGNARANDADQFTISIAATSPIVTSTTSGTGTTIHNGNATALAVAPGTAYAFSETMAAGSVSALTDYTSTYSCSNAASGSATTLPSGTGTTFNVTPAAGDNITCSFTNTPTTATPIAPTLTLTKTIDARAVATDEFTIAISGGGPSATSAGGATVSTSTFTATAGTTYTLNEVGAGAPAANLANYRSTYSCVNNGSGGTDVPAGIGTSFTVHPVAGDAIACTFVNTPLPQLSIAKTHTGNFSVGNTGSYTITPSNVGFGTTSGVITIVDTLPAGLTYQSATGTDWTCGNTAQVITCTSTDAIGAGADGNPITIVANVTAGSLPSVVNTATVQGGGDPTCAQNSPPTRCTATDPTTTPVTLQSFSVD